MRILSPQKVELFNLPRTSGNISMQTRSTLQGLDMPSRLRITQKIGLEPMVVLPGEYPQLLEMSRILSHPKTGMVLLKMKHK